jgi:hypothetical protein
MRRRHRTTSTFALVALLATVVATGSDVRPASAVSGGRVQLQQPVRIGDTRDGVTPTRVTSYALGSGLFHVWFTDAAAGGSATLHTCGQPPGSVPLVVFETSETVYAKVIASNSCLTMSTPTHVVVDGIGTVESVPNASALQYVPRSVPSKVFDDVIPAPAGPSEISTPVDVGAIPVAARAAVVLVEVNDPIGSGYLRVRPCQAPSLLVDVGWINDRSVGIAYVDLTAGPICVSHRGEAGVRLTVLGHLSVDGPDPSRLPPTLSSPVQPVRLPGLRAITPVRLIDTRSGLGVSAPGRLSAGQTLELPITQSAASTTAVALNVTVTEPAATGFLTVYPCDQNRPKVSNLNYVTGETVPNLVNVKLSVTRSVCIFAQQPTHVIADLAGTFEAGGGAGAQPVSPERLLDTRIPIGVPAAGKVVGGEVLTLQVAGRGGVPASGASAVTMNVTVTEPELAGFVTVYPCDRSRPTASNLNYTPGQTVPNLVSVRLSATGTVCLFSQRTTHLVADLSAWYSVDEQDGFRELAPERILDTREGIGAPAAKVTSGSVLALQVAGRGGVPLSGATAVTMNVTVTEAGGDGFVTAYPCDRDRPTASNVNHSSGETVPNLVTVQLSATGTVCLFAQRDVHLLADVAGYFSDSTELRNSTVAG